MKIFTYVLIGLAAIGLGVYVGVAAPQLTKAKEATVTADENLSIAKNNEKKAIANKEEQQELLTKAENLLKTTNSGILQAENQIAILTEKAESEKAESEKAELEETLEALVSSIEEQQKSLELTEAEFIEKYGSFEVVNIDQQINDKKALVSTFIDQVDELNPQIDEASNELEYVELGAVELDKYFASRRSALAKNALTAKVLGYNQEWALVFINAGSSKGITQGAKLLVSENNAPAAECEVLDFTSSRSVAVVTRFYVGGGKKDAPVSLQGGEVILANALSE